MQLTPTEKAEVGPLYAALVADGYDAKLRYERLRRVLIDRHTYDRFFDIQSGFGECRVRVGEEHD